MNGWTRNWVVVALLLGACGQQAQVTNETEAAAPKEGGNEIALTDDQIATAGIELVSPTIGTDGGTIEMPATIESDPDATRVVAAPIEGRIVALKHNIGDPVRRGETLAVLESREAANLQAEAEKARTRLDLARVTLDRDEALYAKGFRPKREVDISRAAYAEAETSLRAARQQVAAAGVRGGSLNRIVITAPIAGRIIARNAVLGQVFTTDATETELFRISDVGRLSVRLSLSPADAARVKPGNEITLTATGRRGAARIGFVSPALDPETRLVPAIARLDNRDGLWRVGEPVTATIHLPGGGDGAIRVPTTAVQTVEGKTVVFVRTATGFRTTPVMLGAQDGDKVIVTAGLTGRERIAAANSFTLKSALGAVGDED
jgi:cobalt-zinc-cadmium efflux system membrane fusion protein